MSGRPRILNYTYIEFVLAAVYIYSVCTRVVLCQHTHAQESKHLTSVILCCTPHTHTLYTARHIHSYKHINIHLTLVLINAAGTHTAAHRLSSYWHNTTWSIEWPCCLDERRLNRKVSIFVEGHGNVNAPQLAKGSQSSGVLHNERWQTQRAFQRKTFVWQTFPFQRRHFTGCHVNLFLHNVGCGSEAIRRLKKRGDQICHCRWLIRGQMGTLCVCKSVFLYGCVCHRLVIGEYAWMNVSFSSN